MDELLKYDSTFSKNLFISKANNIFIMLCTSIMDNDLSRVDHFIGDKLYDNYKKKIEYLKENNLIQVYENLKINLTFITGVKVLEDKFVIEVNMIYSCKNYQIDKDTKKLITGNRNTIERSDTFIFEKRRNFKTLGEVRKCPNCGSPMDLNNNGVCDYCKQVFSQENYDWILVDIIL